MTNRDLLGNKYILDRVIILKAVIELTGFEFFFAWYNSVYVTWKQFNKKKTSLIIHFLINN